MNQSILLSEAQVWNEGNHAVAGTILIKDDGDVVFYEFIPEPWEEFAISGNCKLVNLFSDAPQQEMYAVFPLIRNIKGAWQALIPQGWRYPFVLSVEKKDALAIASGVGAFKAIADLEEEG